MKAAPIEPRKTPRQARSAATVDAVVEAAAHILAQDGLAALNTNAIAARAGVSVGSLYQYFPTKEAILTEILRRKRLRLIQEMTATQAQTEGLPLDEATERLVMTAVRLQAREPKLARALDYVHSAFDLQQEKDEMTKSLALCIEQLLLRHDIPDAPTASADIVAMAKGMMQHAFLNGGADPEAVTVRICRAIRGYLKEAQTAMPTV